METFLNVPRTWSVISCHNINSWFFFFKYLTTCIMTFGISNSVTDKLKNLSYVWVYMKTAPSLRPNFDHVLYWERGVVWSISIYKTWQLDVWCKVANYEWLLWQVSKKVPTNQPCHHSVLLFFAKKSISEKSLPSMN